MLNISHHVVGHVVTLGGHPKYPTCGHLLFSHLYCHLRGMKKRKGHVIQVSIRYIGLKSESLWGDSAEKTGSRNWRSLLGWRRCRVGNLGPMRYSFRTGVLAYNVGRLFVLSTLDMSWHRHQVQTLRWKLYGTAGKIVFHGRYIYLKVSRSLQRLFAQVQLRSWDFALA